MYHFGVLQQPPSAKPNRTDYDQVPDDDENDTSSASSPYSPLSTSIRKRRSKRRRCLAVASAAAAAAVDNNPTVRLALFSFAFIAAIWLGRLVVTTTTRNPGLADDNNNNGGQCCSHETIPTLLSMVDPFTHRFICALDNPLYNELQDAVLLHDSKSRRSKSSFFFWKDVTEFPEISLDLERERLMVRNDDDDDHTNHPSERTSLTISWTKGKDARGHSVLRKNNDDGDTDILVLQCGGGGVDDRTGQQQQQQPNTDWRIVEAATLAQVRATHRYHYNANNSNRSGRRRRRSLNLWYHSNDAEDWSTGWYSSSSSNSNEKWHNSSRSSSNQDKWHNRSSGGGNEWYIADVPSSILRQEYCQFVLYQKIQPLEYVAVAESAIIQFGQVNKPFGIHLALTATADRMLVQFTTGAITGNPVAMYGTQADLLSSNNKATGTTTTYTAADLCQAPANETALGKFQSPGYLRAIELTGLEPDTVYYYKVGLETTTGQGVTWSRTYQFTTALSAGDATEHTYLVYGDQGCPEGGWTEGSAWVANMAAREVGTIRSIHHVGDLSYAQGAAHQWDAWLSMIEPLSARVPLMIAVGNHEYDHESGGGAKDPSHYVETESGFMPVWGDFGNDSGGECGVPTSKRFTMPATGNGVFWYSYDYGLVHTVVISSEHDLSAGSPQHVWLANDLHKTDRSITPWLVVESHRPFYEGNLNQKDSSVGAAMRLEVEDLLYDYNVDLVIAGHYHAYIRTCDGLYRSKCDNGGPTHVTIGTGGAHLTDDDIGIFTNSWTNTVMLHSYGYGRISVQSKNTLHFEFVKAGSDADTIAGVVLDDFWMNRER